MKRYGMVANLRHGQYEEYKRLHADVWPDVLRVIKESNISNYSIFYDNGKLFSYFEYTGEDFESDMEKMADDKVTKKWWAVCTPCLESFGPRDEGKWWDSMEDLFYLE